MNKEFEIELQDESIDMSDGIRLPVNFLAFGEIESDDVKVYIKQDVYKALEKFSASNASKELGSILLGDYCQELGKTNVIISQYIEAKYTDASASTLTFTHETWNYIHSTHEQLYGDKKIIGWQHTHPNYGIFLSNYDLFIQENYFNLPFQVAYVIDPIQNIRGFFQWKNGKIEKLKGFYIYDDVGKPIKIEQTKVKKEEVISRKNSKVISVIIALLCLSTCLLSFFTFSLNQKYEQQIKEQELIINELSSQSDIIDEQSNTIVKLQEQLVTGILDRSGQTTAEELIAMIESHELVLQNQEAVLSELKEFVEEQKSQNESTDTKEVAFFAYTVLPGDSLHQICKDHDLDYSSNIKIILAINGISNPNEIYVGQTVLLPLAN
ncbi:MAG: LysM peptidoglycan-binding domain-containing protein [Neglectibacter timonensis]